MIKGNNENKRIKVAWICHFSNSEVREKLPLSKMWVNKLLRRIFKFKNFHAHSDYAPWVNTLIKEFKHFNEVELHIIAPYQGLKRIRKSFSLDGINYYFFKSDIPLLNIPIPEKLNKNGRLFWLNRFIVKKFIKKIKPDIVNLIGTEIPYYSITSLDIKNIPVYVSVQTVYTNPNRKKYSEQFSQFIWDLELKIHKKEQYYGCLGRMHYDLIKRNNPEATIFKMFFPLERPRNILPKPKKYNFVFYSVTLSKKKGVDDAIKAMAIVKKKYPDVTLNIIGKCNSSFKRYLQNIINESSLNENIVFNDYFPKHSDLHQHIVQAQYALLPVKLDIISTSIIEAIFLDLPVITYKTTGTPYLNKDGEAILIADIGHIEGLANNMMRLLESPSLADTLKKNARAVVNKEFDNLNSIKRLLSNYKAVIANYYNKVPIPQDQLFNIKEFPIY